MQSNPEHVHAEPRKARHNIAEDRHHHQATLANEYAPARVQNNRAPENDQHCTIFFRIPTPEPSPGLVRPNSAEHSADETEQRRKANNAVSHPSERLGGLFRERTSENAAHDVNDREHSSEKHRGVTGSDCDYVSGEPDVRIKYGLQHF